MKTQFILAHGMWSPHAGWQWGFVILFLLILFITLVVSEGSRDKKDKEK